MAVFTPNYYSLCLFSSLAVSERQNVTFNIHNKLLANPPEFPVPDDEQAVRGHPANRSLSKHPSVLCGSDLITVPGPCHLCRRRPLGGHRSPSHPAAIEDYSPPLPPLLRPLFLLPRGILTFSDRLNSFTSWVVFMSFIFLSPPPSSSSSFLL